MTKRKHITHVVYRFDTGGLENGMVNLINRLDESLYQHTIVTMKGHNPDFAKRIKTNNVTFADLNKSDGNDLKIFGRLNRLLKQLNPDVLHTRNTATLEMQLVGWWRKVALRIHGEHGWDVNDMYGTNKKYRLLRKVMKLFVHRYIALSKEAYNYLVSIIGIERARVAHICNGVDVVKFHPGQCSVVDTPSGFVSENHLIFGTVGRLAEVKNQHFLLDSFISLIDLFPEQKERLKLLIVGDGVLLSSLEEKVKRAGLEKNVWFAGNRHDVPELMKMMDVFVLPSLAEGISNTILESMASGLPVIATDVGGNPELIESTLKSSHLVKVNETKELVKAMSQYVEQGELVSTNSKICRAHCEANFSIESMVAKYHHLYQTKKD